MTLWTLNYGNYGIFLIMGNAGFCPSTIGLRKIIELKVWGLIRAADIDSLDHATCASHKCGGKLVGPFG